MIINPYFAYQNKSRNLHDKFASSEIEKQRAKHSLTRAQPNVQLMKKKLTRNPTGSVQSNAPTHNVDNFWLVIRLGSALPFPTYLSGVAKQPGGDGKIKWMILYTISIYVVAQLKWCFLPLITRSRCKCLDARNLSCSLQPKHFWQENAGKNYAETAWNISAYSKFASRCSFCSYR